MARPLRIEFPGALYHITARGNARADIYLDDRDRHNFLQQIYAVCERYNWRCYGYCLMTNHYHLVMVTGDATLSKGMRALNGVYSQTFNRSHRRVGHLFQGRYGAVLIDKEAYLLELIRYVLLNPVRAHMTKSAGQYRWSSYRAMIGKAACPDWLGRDWVLSQFGKHKTRAQAKFIQFIRNGANQPPLWENLRNQIYLGDEHFVERAQKGLPEIKIPGEIPRLQHRKPPKPLEYYAKQFPVKEAMRIAYATGEYSLKAIADYFGVHYSTVSRAAKVQ